MDDIRGIVTGGAALSGGVTVEAVLTGIMEAGGTVPLPPYEGAYIIVPSDVGQVLDTAGKRMTDDLEVQAIPYEAVSNESGGLTVTIGMH